MDYTFYLWVIGVIGAILNVKKRVEGYYFWVAGDVAWVYIDYIHHLPWQSALFIVNIMLGIWGIWQWSRNENNPA